jgi:replicative DNA helicase
MLALIYAYTYIIHTRHKTHGTTFFPLQAKPSMQKSSVVDNATGKSVDSQIRTSTGTFLAMHEDDIVARIEKRVAQVTMIPQGGC